MIVQCKEEDVEKNGYTQTDRQTDIQTEMLNTDPVSPRTGLGKKYIQFNNINRKVFTFFVDYSVSLCNVIIKSIQPINLEKFIIEKGEDWRL